MGEHQSQGSEHLCAQSALQNGGHTHAKGCSEERRLDDKDRAQRCIFHDTCDTQPQTPAPVKVAGENLPVHLSTLRPVLSTMGIHQNYQTHHDHTEVFRPENDHLYRRHSPDGGDQVSSSGPHGRSDFPPGKPEVHNQPEKVNCGPYAEDRFPRVFCTLPNYGDQGARGKNSPPEARSAENSTLGRWPEGYRPIPLAWEAEPCSTRHSPSPPVLQTLANVPSDSTGDNGRTGLHEQSSSDTGSKGGAILVGATPYQMEWSLPNAKRPRPDNNDGRLQYRLECGMSGGEDRGSLVKDGSHYAHKLPGAAGSNAGGQMLCQGPTRYTDSFKDGQLDCPNVHKQAWGHSFPTTESHDQGTVDVVPGSRHQPTIPSSWFTKCDSIRGISCDERQDRLDAQSPDFQPDQSGPGTSGGGPIRLAANSPTAALCELEARPRCYGNRCIQHELDKVPGVCQPALT